MISLSLQAAMQVASITAYYEQQGYYRAIERAARQIADNPDGGILAPRTYPNLAARGRLWLHVHRYWIAYMGDPLTIIAVINDSWNLPDHI